VALAVVGGLAAGGAASGKREGLGEVVRGWAGLGVARERSAAAAIGTALAMSAAISALLSLATCIVCHGPSDPALAPDAWASLWIGGLAGAAYAAYFAMPESIGRGGLRTMFFGADWLVGSGTGALSVVTPRRHISALFGGELSANLSQRASCIVLVLMAIAGGWLAWSRARRA